MLAETDATLSHVVVNGEDGGVRDLLSEVRKAKAYALMAASRKIGTRVGLSCPLFEAHDIDSIDLFENHELRYCEPDPAEGIGRTLPAEVVGSLDENCDVIVRYGFGIIKGEVLEASEYGVLSYHHGDIREYRGRPAGFWEFLNGESHAGITLQQLAPKLDAGEIVRYREVGIDSTDTYQDVRNRIFRESIGMLAAAIEDIENGDFTSYSTEDFGELYKAPTWPTWAKYYVKNTSRRLGR
jgi:folate-dependent phosphoribosylglycinamide formyltransferase PurN